MTNVNITLLHNVVSLHINIPKMRQYNTAVTSVNINLLQWVVSLYIINPNIQTKNLENSSSVLPWCQGFQKGITCGVTMSKPISRHPKSLKPKILYILDLPVNSDGDKKSYKDIQCTPMVPRIPKRYHMWGYNVQTSIKTPKIL